VYYASQHGDYQPHTYKRSSRQLWLTRGVDDVVEFTVDVGPVDFGLIRVTSEHMKNIMSVVIRQVRSWFTSVAALNSVHTLSANILPLHQLVEQLQPPRVETRRIHRKPAVRCGHVKRPHSAPSLRLPQFGIAYDDGPPATVVVGQSLPLQDLGDAGPGQPRGGEVQHAHA
jgi:hypothetical protein